VRTSAAALERSALALAVAVAAGAVTALPARAQSAFVFDRDCARWIDQHGYSADYIKSKTGKRQPGTPNGWRSNVEKQNVQPGDVVITLLREKGQAMRASYVETVTRNPDGSVFGVVVSEWNEGRYIDERCFVTDHFGRLSPERPLPLAEVVKVWRPTLPL
jgi:hypothetical protein